MRGISIIHSLLGIMFIFTFSPCFSAETNALGGESSKYLNAVREFADNVLKYGRDTYGPKHTPLFVDGLNIHTHEPVKWISPVGDVLTPTETKEWILSNFASQQTLLRTLDGLSAITGDSKYCDAAIQATKYTLENLMGPKGLLYWGEGTAYDALADTVCGGEMIESIKLHYPYYELMWKVDPEVTKKLIGTIWSAHVVDWSNLEIDRIGSRLEDFEKPWDHEYKGGPTIFESKRSWGISNVVTASSLIQAGATLNKLSGDQQPLIWSKRLAKRFVDTRYPNTGISSLTYGGKRWQDRFVEDIQGNSRDPHAAVFPWDLFQAPPRSHYYPENAQAQPWIALFLVGELLGENGREFTQWAIEELNAWGKASYRKEDNCFVPMLTDGTILEGYVWKNGPGQSTGYNKVRPYPADMSFFWAYSIAYGRTGDEFMWEMVRSIGLGNELGDIGQTPMSGAARQISTNCSHPYGIFGFLELYRKTNQRVYLKMARRIADNIVKDRFYKGYFSPSKEHIYTRVGCFEPLALLRLEAVMGSKSDAVPQPWPCLPLFVYGYRHKIQGVDRHVIYGLTESSESPISIEEAAAIGDIDRIKELIGSGVRVGAFDSLSYMTPLHRAAMEGQKSAVELLLAEDAPINERDIPLNTPLTYAVINNHKDIAELLIDNGANVNAKNNDGQTPLEIAQRRNLREIVELLAKVADIPSIHVAAQLGDMDKVKALLEEGADVNAKDENGMTPLLLATSNKQVDVAKFLIEKGADINLGDKQGVVPLFRALWNKDLDMLELLLKKGADVNAKHARSGFTVLHWAAMMDSKESVELILDARADVNGKCNTGETPLDVAAIWGVSTEMAELLVAKGAEVSSLHTAAFMGDLPKVRALITKGVEVDKKSGMIAVTALHSAAAAGHKEMVEFLISKGSDVNAQNRPGRTPLHMAAEKGHIDVVELLLKSGADVNAKDRRGRTPVDLAQNAGQKATVELLVQDVAVTDISVPSTCEQGNPISVVATIENRAYRRNSLNIRLIDTTADQEIGKRTVVLLGKRQSKPDLSFDTSSGGIADTGNRVRMNGDMNGDGYKDILLNGPMWNDYRGRVFLYFGGPNLNTIPDMIFSGENPRDRFGDYGAIATSDLNKDGFDDVIIGSFGYPDGKNDGRVYIYYGGADMDTVPDIVFDGEIGQHSFFGVTLAASDVDHDGSVDLLVGAQNYDHGGEYHRITITREFGPLNGRGRVYLYWGGDPMDTNPDIIFEGENRGDWFGRRISAGGDINGDGYNDLLVGARHAINDSRGRAYLFWGNTRNQMNATYGWIFTGEDKNDNMGSSVCIFDIDSDGYSDVILGARFAADYTGRVYIHWGERDFDGSKPDVVLEGEAVSRMGGDDITCGYFNEDKYGDILAGAWGGGTNNWGVKNRGHAYLFYGNTKSLINAECDHIFESEDREGVENWFGLSVSAGDVNNDNYDDVLIGAPKAYDKAGRAYLYYGPFHSTTDITFTWDTTNASIGKHTLKVEITPVPGEQNSEDNGKTVTIEVKESLN